MVWATVILGVLSVVSDVLLWMEHRRAVALKLAMDDEHAQAASLVEKRKAEWMALIQRAEAAEARYDALVDKMAARKPDDGIIHAKNSGDVRRIFEQHVKAQMAEAEKRLEN